MAGLVVDWEDTGYFDMFAITSGPAPQVGALANPSFVRRWRTRCPTTRC